MAVVFLAQDLRHDRKVALKVLRPDISAAIGADRFLREIKLAAGLTHPHILPVYDSGEAGGLLFYVMPNMEGARCGSGSSASGSFRCDEALPHHPARSPPRSTTRTGSRVVHRDIKPENILLHEGVGHGGRLRHRQGAEQRDAVASPRPGMAVGTPAYMSPEQAAGEPDVDGRSDLYSLGCVLYEMLTGEPPFTGPTAQAIIAKRFISPDSQACGSRATCPRRSTTR